jgi:hypothetical protein
MPPKKTSAWIMHVKSFALKNGISYACALSDARCKSSYKNGGVGMSPPKIEMIEMTEKKGEMTAKQLARKIKNIELTAQVRKNKILKGDMV